MPRVEEFPILSTRPPESRRSEAPSRVTTTLYDVIAALQTWSSPRMTPWWSPLSPRGCVPGASVGPLT
jgi:hypothetical protein